MFAYDYDVQTFHTPVVAVYVTVFVCTGKIIIDIKSCMERSRQKKDSLNVTTISGKYIDTHIHTIHVKCFSFKNSRLKHCKN